MRLRAANDRRPRGREEIEKISEKKMSQVVHTPSPQVGTTNANPYRIEEKQSWTEKEWAEKHGRKYIEPPVSKKGLPAKAPQPQQNAKIMVEATPPVGNVPDPNNSGNVLICHNTGTSFVTLSIPTGSLSLYNNSNNSDGACVPAGSTYCPPGSTPDCAGVCNGPSLLDCHGNCYNPVNTPAAWLRDCSGVCYATSGRPPNVPDCNGVCGGNSVRDCAGVCDGHATKDCAGVCNGTHYVDCGGNCNSTCAKVNSAPPVAKPVVQNSRSNLFQAAQPKPQPQVSNQSGRQNATQAYVLKLAKRR